MPLDDFFFFFGLESLEFGGSDCGCARDTWLQFQGYLTFLTKLELGQNVELITTYKLNNLAKFFAKES